ncbi:MAG TPA: TIGR03067 domain-containing protein [Gemmataceae bacterium]|jgi:uncharacterized protein (TIGR03067 family)|nr:TIGR03067 domain-containing protein [Gemmataceae bacterium]
MTASIVMLALSINAPQLKPPPAPAPPILGRWQATQITIGGVDNTKGNTELEYEFTADGRWVIYRGGKPLGDMPRTFTFDTKATPAAIDLTETAGNPQPGIYKVEKDTLTVSFNFGKGERPTAFDGPQANVMTLVMKRVKE